nr:MAG TPA: hypothetical protein [Caudoviricetes sp.]
MNSGAIIQYGYSVLLRSVSGRCCTWGNSGVSRNCDGDVPD